MGTTVRIHSKIKLTPIADLIANERNSRTHSPEQIEQIVEGIKRFGFTNPILADENGVIIAGHGRLTAAELVGLKEVPVITLEGLSEDEKRAYLIADNKIALNAGWNQDLLDAEIAYLSKVEGLDISIVGFSDKELEEITARFNEANSEDEAPEEFDEHGENIETEYRCPSCNYEWSGKKK